VDNYTFDFTIFLRHAGLLASGLMVTMALAIGATVIGVALGIGGALLKRSDIVWLRRAAEGYVELFRNTPFIVQLFFFYFGLPSLGVRLEAWTCALLAMSINMGAYATEIIRAGLDAVPQGQREAAIALGIQKPIILRFVVLPQAIKIVYPALCSQIIITTLETAVVSKIAVPDLTDAADIIQADTFRSFEVYFFVGAIYLLVTIIVRRCLNWIGRTFVRGFRLS
jgi:polar amino acid transport system permease protein